MSANASAALSSSEASAALHDTSVDVQGAAPHGDAATATAQVDAPSSTTSGATTMEAVVVSATATGTTDVCAETTQASAAIVVADKASPTYVQMWGEGCGPPTRWWLTTGVGG